MTTLYPIGTELITRRESQIWLAVEIFGKQAEFFCKKECTWLPYFENTPAIIRLLRIVVIPKNQVWLSPVPIAGDLGHFVVNENFDGKPFLEYGVIYEDEGSFWLNKPDVCPEVIITNPLNVVEKRTYPNGQRAPLIERDEVILPKGAVI